MLEAFTCGPYGTQTYLMLQEKEKIAILIDAAPDSFAQLESKVKGYAIHLFLTHGHWDHIGDAHLFKEKLSAKIYFPEADSYWLNPDHQRLITPPSYVFTSFNPDVYLKEETEIQVGSFKLKVILIPGHTEGQIGIYDETNSRIFVGDTLFRNGFGRTDLYGGSSKILRESLQKLFQDLPLNTLVYPGHGPQTTLEKERSNFRFLN